MIWIGIALLDIAGICLILWICSQVCGVRMVRK
jgi:hypothetical protein